MLDLFANGKRIMVVNDDNSTEILDEQVKQSIEEISKKPKIENKE